MLWVTLAQKHRLTIGNAKRWLPNALWTNRIIRIQFRMCQGMTSYLPLFLPSLLSGALRCRNIRRKSRAVSAVPLHDVQVFVALCVWSHAIGVMSGIRYEIGDIVSYLYSRTETGCAG